MKQEIEVSQEFMVHLDHPVQKVIVVLLVKLDLMVSKATLECQDFQEERVEGEKKEILVCLVLDHLDPKDNLE